MLQYRREIDGLRAIAVLPVIWYHAGFSFFSGGFLGVDVFFVISGYLITGIILSEVLKGEFSFWGFYERRARRILPALFVVLFSSVPLAWLVMLPQDFKDFSQSLVAVNFFSSNILFQLESGYFDTEAELKPLLHTWSLAIEEQFYLIFPSVLLLILKFGRSSIYWILGLVLVISLITAEVGVYLSPEANFFFLPSRIWELMLGAILAFYVFDDRSKPVEVSQSKREIGSSAGLILIVYSFLVFDDLSPSPSVYNLIPTVGTALIIYYGTSETRVGKLLGHRIVVGIGLISYSAYLWHNPLFTFARLNENTEASVATFLVLTLVALLLAAISWKYIESPFRNKSRIKRSSVFLMSGTAATILIAVGLVGHLTQGFEKYYVENRLDVAEKNVYSTIKTHGGPGMAMTEDMADDGRCNFWMPSLNDEFVKRYEDCSEKFGAGVFVLGDSHAMNIYNSLYWAKYSPFLVSVSIGRCRPSEPRESCDFDEFLSFSKSHASSIKSVIFHQSGFQLLRNIDSKRTDVDIFFENIDYEMAEERVQNVISYINSIEGVNEIIWLGPFPEARVNYREISHLAENGFSMNSRSLEIFAYLDRELQDIVTDYQQLFKYIPFSEVISMDEDFLLISDCLTFRDRDHMSVCGERIVGEALANYLRKH